jgi:type II secretory pathway predicted ATPase ExeA
MTKSPNPFGSNRPLIIRSADQRSAKTPLLGLDGLPIEVERGTAAIGQEGSLVYEPYYGLKEKPFSLSADPRFLYKSQSHGPAFDELLAAIRRREGLIVLTGDIGTGKTTLCRAVLKHLDRKTFTTFVPDPFLSREDLLKMLLVDFGVMSVEDLKMGRLKGASRADLNYVLNEFLVSLAPLQAFAVLIIDEAQNLSLPLLEEIRILSELEDHGKLLQVVLVGQCELRSHLKQPEMRQVDQRVSVRCELRPLSRDGVTGYVRHRLDVAGGGNCRVEFSASALDDVYRGSGGVPRLVNLICDRALHQGHSRRTTRIEPELISGAMADLDLSVSEAPEPLGRSAATPRGPLQKGVQTDLERADPLSFFAPESAKPAGNTRPESSPVPAAGPSRRAWWIGAALLLSVAAGAIGTTIQLRYLEGMQQAEPVADPPPAPLVLAAPSLETRLPPDAAQVARLPEAASTETFDSPDVATVHAYQIQVASFESGGRATALVEDLKHAGFDSATAGRLGRLHQVIVGPYETFREAEIVLALIHEIPGYADAIILNPQQRHPR